MHRFFVDSLSSPNSAIFHQVQNVLRLELGEHFMLLDNTGFEYEVEILSFEKNRIHFQVLSKKKNENEPRLRLVLYQALPKKMELLEMVLQKGTEIGVKKFVPLITARTERKTIPKKERMLRILKEAAEQSGRGIIPELEEPQRFEDVVKNLKASGYLFDSSGKDFAREKIKETVIAALIGPEGGFTEEEISMAKNHGVHIVSLGPLILRTETAGIVIPALFLLQ